MKPSTAIRVALAVGVALAAAITGVLYAIGVAVNGGDRS